jgi:hypothetical protein
MKSNQKFYLKSAHLQNSTNISSHELLKPTCILRYELQKNVQHNKIKNKIMLCIKTTYMYQAKIKCKHIYDLISGPPQSVHMWEVPLCTLTVIGPENSI